MGMPKLSLFHQKLHPLTYLKIKLT